MPKKDLVSVPPKSLQAALEYVQRGGVLVVATSMRVTIIKQKDIAAWDRAGKPLLREEGDGYRMRQGRGSVYLVPGLLAYA